jgi:hypothetical protein
VRRDECFVAAGWHPQAHLWHAAQVLRHR